MSYHNWDSYSHQTLYDRIHGNGGFFVPDGAGVSGAAGAQEGWGELATLMAQARERTEAALAKAGAVWEGDAGEAMQSGVTPLARWADDAHIASVASQHSTDAHVEAYSAAKNQMPEPVEVTSTANGDYGGIPAGFTHLLGGQTDQDKQEAAAQEAKAEAVRTMQRYEVESATSSATLGQFEPPASVTVNVAPLQPKSGDVIPVGVTEWPGTGRVDDGGQPGTGPAPGDTRGPGNRPGDTPGHGSTPPPGGGSTPAPGQTTTPHGSTTPSVFTPAPASVASPEGNPGSAGFGPDRSVGSPGMGAFGGPGESGAPEGRGSGGRGPAGRGFGGGSTEGRGPGGASPGSGRGLANEAVAGRAGARGAAGGAGMAPVGGRGEGDEDKEHKAAEYLLASHDDFWDGSPPVAPAVIGDDEDDE